MMLLALVAILFPARLALASCAAPKFPTQCVKAKVLKALPVNPDVAKWFGGSNPACHIEIQSKGFRGGVYLVGDKASCPKVGSTIGGDLTIRCNDAGKDEPDIFTIKTGC